MSAHKTPREVWWWLTLGAVLLICAVVEAFDRNWDKALMDLALGSADLLIASLTDRLSKARRDRDLLLGALKPFATKRGGLR